jgi:hypothetical protein
MPCQDSRSWLQGWQVCDKAVICGACNIQLQGPDVILGPILSVKVQAPFVVVDSAVHIHVLGVRHMPVGDVYR